jgi:hypothetical protein
MLTGTFHTIRCDLAVRAAVTPLLTAPALGWSVALGIVIRPADNNVVDGLDVAELASCHSALREVEDVVVVLQRLFMGLMSSRMMPRSVRASCISFISMSARPSRTILAKNGSFRSLQRFKNVSYSSMVAILKTVPPWICFSRKMLFFHVRKNNFGSNAGELPFDGDRGHSNPF